MFLQLRQVRAALRLDDTARAAEVGHLRSRRLDEFGVPSGFGDAPEGALLVLSSGCVTCHAIGGQLSGGLPQGLWVLVEDYTAGMTFDDGSETESFAERYQLVHPRVCIDQDGEVAERMRIATTPLLLLLENGRVRDGYVLSSARQLWSLLPERQVIGTA